MESKSRSESESNGDEERKQESVKEEGFAEPALQFEMEDHDGHQEQGSTENFKGSSKSATNPTPSKETTADSRAEAGRIESQLPDESSNHKTTDQSPSNQAADEIIPQAANHKLESADQDGSRDKRLAAEVKAKMAAGPADNEKEDSDDDDWQDAVEDNSAANKSQTQGDNSVKTALSWEDGSRNVEDNEHRTACAFSFNNAVMFDLDNE